MAMSEDDSGWEPLAPNEPVDPDRFEATAPEEMPEWYTEGGGNSIRSNFKQKMSSRGTRNIVSSGYRFLKTHGPTATRDLDAGITNTDRKRRGVRRLTGPRNYVWYIEDEHDMTDVVRTFFEANPQLQEKSKQSLGMKFNKHSSEMKAAFDEVAPEYGIRGRRNTGGGNKPNPTCPICGEQMSGVELPDHIGTHGDQP